MSADGQIVKYDALCHFVNPIRILNPSYRDITSIAPIEEAKCDQLSFCNNVEESALRAISASHAGIIICRDDIPGLERSEVKHCLFTVANPRLSFIRCANRFFGSRRQNSIHPTAIIEQDSVIGHNVDIGPNTYIGHQVVIGDGAIIEDRVHVAGGSKIGRNVYLQTGAVIGCEGQGFERGEDGSFEKFPQIGWVVLEDEVEVGANSTIVRGTFGSTRVGKGSKIGHLCDIGHNAQIGKHVFISAGVVVCGSATVNDFCWLAPKCCIRNKVRLGTKVTVGIGSVVTHHVADGLTVIGVPARGIMK